MLLEGPRHLVGVAPGTNEEQGRGARGQFGLDLVNECLVNPRSFHRFANESTAARAAKPPTKEPRRREPPEKEEANQTAVESAAKS